MLVFDLSQRLQDAQRSLSTLGYELRIRAAAGACLGLEFPRAATGSLKGVEFSAATGFRIRRGICVVAGFRVRIRGVTSAVKVRV